MSVRMSLVAAFAATVVGCADDAADSTALDDGTYVIRTTDRSVWAAVEVRGDSAIAFVCGRDETLTTATRWMTGSVDGTSFSLREGDWTLNLEAASDSLSGRLEGPAFDDAIAGGGIDRGSPPETPAGLFTNIVDGCRAGLIVDSSGQARGAYCDEFGFLSQVTPVRPLTQNTWQVEALGADGDTVSFEVEGVELTEIQAEISATR
ncbi:MAG: hypothetical protein AAGA56_09930 [Myxococcota bacterium]